MSIFFGCPVWSYKGWVGNFYPKGTKPANFLREYAKRVTTIEGNTTFYAVPSQKTIENWVAETPETFRFCPKVPKAISHEGTLIDNVDRARVFVDVMKQLGIRLGPIFLQLPPRFSSKLIGDLETFLSAWASDVRLAVEVRHLDWFESPYDETLDQLLASHNMARVTIDTRPIRSLAGDQSLAGSTYESLLEARERKPDVPVVPKRISDFVFVRYIGHPELEQNIALIDEWVDFLVPQLQAGADAFIFCHTPENLGSPEICREFHRRINARIKISPLPWNEIEPDIPEQPNLF